MKIQCPSCKKILENPNWNPKDTCINCKCYFIPLQTQPIQPQSGLGQQFEQIGQSFQQMSNVPHIMIGKQGISTNQNQPIQQTQPIYQNNQNIQPQYPQTPQNNQFQHNPYLNPDLTRKEDTFDKIRKWGFIFIIAVVVCYAGFRIISSLL